MGGISRDGPAIKMAVYWPRPFFAFLLTTTSSRPKKSKKELGQYPRLVNCDNYCRVIMWQSEDFLVAISLVARLP